MAFPTAAQFEAGFSVVAGQSAGDASTIHVKALYDVLKLLFGSGAFKLPQYTSTERDALTTMVKGDMIYNTTTDKLNFYNGAAWVAVTSA